MEQELEQSLLPASSGTENFAIRKDYLSSFFDLQSIEKGLSLRNLRTIGGHSAIMNILKVNPKIFEQFEDKLLRVLCAAALISLIIGVFKEGLAEGWMDGFGIFLAVIIIVSVTATNNYMKDQQFRKLYAQLDDKKIQLLRSGQYITTSVYNILVGDILVINTGDIMSVDGLIIKGSQVAIDESPLTGESRPQYKEPFNPNHSDDAPSPFVISGTRVIEGVGEVLVCAVGPNTVTGKLKKQLMEEDETPLQEKLDDLVDDIGKMGVTAAFATFGCMLLHFIWIEWSHSQTLFGMNFVMAVVDYFIIAVTIIVVAVPEGLPLAVTIALAYSVGKMKNENNLVRYLAACETMGGADNICSDKTGTLTMNKMTVTALFSEEVLHAKIEKKNISTKTLKRLCEAICVNSVSHPKISINGVFEASGNPTECALLEFSYKMGYNYQNYRPSENIKKVFPFSSLKKKMSAIHQTTDNPAVLYIKGAPDFLIDNCSYFLNKDGEPIAFTEEMKERVKKKAIKKFAQSALRAILVAYKEIPSSINYENVQEGEFEKDMILIGIAGIQDPLREEIPEAVKVCSGAGVCVRMVTGDNKDTAIQIAKEANILRRDYDPAVDKFMVMEGSEFRDYVGSVKEGDKIKSVGDLNRFKEVATRLKVLARSLPEDKYLLVTGLKQLKHVVAVTGDGTNDAPALKKADVGFAMGITGTEIAKEAAGIILMDDNFKSIVTAIKWGRNIYESIQKFLQFQLTVNIVAIFMVFVGGVILTESPLTTIQMLWVNLIMDTLASLALATEPPKEELLLRKPVRREDSLIQPIMWRNIICQAVYQIVVLSWFLFSEEDVFKYTSIENKEVFMDELGEHYTMFFNIFVFLQVFNEINARKLKKEEINVFEEFFNNNIFLGVIFGTFFIQILFSQIGGNMLRCVPLDFDDFVFCILIGAGSLVVGFVSKKLPDNFFQIFPIFREDEERVSIKRDKSRMHMREKLRKSTKAGGSFMQIGSFQV